MHRADNTKFLLFIEPKREEKSSTPFNDDFVEVMKMALDKAKEGVSNYSRSDEEPVFSEGAGYKGVHHTACGKSSSNQDYLLENGMVTNSLAPFYLEHYRSAIPETEMKKVNELVKFYKR